MLHHTHNMLAFARGQTGAHPAILHQPGDHYDYAHLLLPDHLPEISCAPPERSLSGNIGARRSKALATAEEVSRGG